MMNRLLALKCTMITFALLGCSESTVDELSTNDEIPKFVALYEKPLADILYCLGLHFDGYRHGAGISTSYNQLISSDKRSGRFSLIQNFSHLPLAVFDFDDGSVTLKTSDDLDRAFYINHKKSKEFVILRSRQACLA